MGWSFTNNAKRSDIINEITGTWERTNMDGVHVKTECIAKCYRGSSFAGTLYAVMERTRTGLDGSVKKDRFIYVALMKYSNYNSDHSWGYKDMDETSGPNVDGCPKKYFAMVPCPDHPWAKGWRKRCALAHNLKDLRRSLNKAVRSGKLDLAAGHKEYIEATEEYQRKMEEVRVETDAEYEAFAASRNEVAV